MSSLVFFFAQIGNWSGYAIPFDFLLCKKSCNDIQAEKKTHRHATFPLTFASFFWYENEDFSPFTESDETHTLLENFFPRILIQAKHYAIFNPSKRKYSEPLDTLRYVLLYIHSTTRIHMIQQSLSKLHNVGWGAKTRVHFSQRIVFYGQICKLFIGAIQWDPLPNQWLIEFMNSFPPNGKYCFSTDSLRFLVFFTFWKDILFFSAR